MLHWGFQKLSKPVSRRSAGIALAGLAILVAGTILARSRRDSEDVKPEGVPASQPAISVTALPAAATVVSAHRVIPAAAMPAQYQGLLTRSIFSRQGVAKDKDKDRSGADARRAEADFVLRGIVLQEGTYVAFIENTGKTRVLQLHQGDSVARGRLSRISFSGVDYEVPGKTTAISIGYSLDGTARASVPVPTTESFANPDSQDGKISKKRRASKEAAPVEPATAPAVEDPSQKAR